MPIVQNKNRKGEVSEQLQKQTPARRQHAGGLIRPRDGNPEKAQSDMPGFITQDSQTASKNALVRSALLYLGLTLDETTRISPRRNTLPKLMHMPRAVVC